MCSSRNAVGRATVRLFMMRIARINSYSCQDKCNAMYTHHTHTRSISVIYSNV